MKRNPFQSTTYAQPVLASELRFGNNTERAIGGNGELNASSKVDLLQQIAKLAEIASTQGVIPMASTSAEKRQAHAQAVTAAFASEEAHMEVGEVIADELYQAANREGFMRRFLARQELAQGQIPRVKMRMKNVVAVVAGSPSKVQTQLVRDNTYFPPEFYITTRPFIEKRELDQSSGDVLEEKYIEALEGTMVAEDRVFMNLANATVNVANQKTTIVGTMNPAGLAALRNQVTRWNIPAANWLIANDIWNDIIGDSGFQQLIDPVSKHELLLTGQLGTILGMFIFSDGYRHPQHRVLSQGDMVIVGDPVNTGTYTDRGGIESSPVDASIEGILGRGWMMGESISAVIANARAIAIGKRT